MPRSFRPLGLAVVAALVLAGSSLSAAPAKAKTQSLIGTLQKVDGQTLTIQTKKGPETVMLAPSAQIHRGTAAQTASDLASDTGSRVKVRYTVANGEKEASSVMVSSPTKAASGSHRAHKPR